MTINPKTEQERELLFPSEVAQMLHVDPKTVTRWAANGKIDVIYTPGGHSRYRRSDINAILNGTGRKTFNEVVAMAREATGPRGHLLLDWTDEDGDPSTTAITALIDRDGLVISVTRETASEAVEAVLAKLENYLADAS
jgi:hypothetical protein